MSARALGRFFGAWAVSLVVLLVAMRSYMSLRAPASQVVVESQWKGGRRVARSVHAVGEEKPPPVDVDDAQEEILGEGPLLTTSLAFDMGLVPGKEGVKATLDGKTAYATVDDLMSAQAYDRGHLWVEASFGWGTSRPVVLSILADQLGVSAQEVRDRASFRRVRFHRRAWQAARNGPPPPMDTRPPHIEQEDLTRPLVLEALHEAATHLARDVDGNGRFRYMIDAPSNRTLPGYNWPRHSGATFFLAQAAGILDDPFIRFAALRAASRLRNDTMQMCGRKERCISEDAAITDLGSSALALIAFTEIVKTGADGTYRKEIAELASFLRSMQRPDGEFMHLYDRASGKPIDTQLLYYSGEATLGLARAHAVLGNPEDLEAARRALAYISGKGWSFFGSRYYFSEEHWTCQSVAELWARAPDRDALAFCARWHEYQRRLQYGPDDSPFDADGAFGFGPLVSPRTTPASSRGEAAGALLDVLLRDATGAAKVGADISEVRTEFERALAFVLRQQFHPGPTYLFADPVAVRGALPGSPVDWQLRIDYAQHAGCMMARWLEIDALKTAR